MTVVIVAAIDMHIFIDITARCNHACVYCCKAFRGTSDLTMTTALLDKIVALPKRSLVISGGEPALVKNEVDYVLERADCPVTINTNLTAWSRESLCALSDRVRWNVSVPSMHEDVYSMVTGADTYKKLVQNIDLIDRKSHINIVVHAMTHDTVEDSVAQLVARGFGNISLQSAYSKPVEKSTFLQTEKSVARLRKRHAGCDIRIGCAPCNTLHVPVGHWCNAGLGRLTILCNGDVVPCACGELPILGNIMDSRATPQALMEAGSAFYASFKPAQRHLCKGFI